MTEQPGHSLMLIRVFAGCMKSSWVLIYQLNRGTKTLLGNKEHNKMFVEGDVGRSQCIIGEQGYWYTTGSRVATVRGKSLKNEILFLVSEFHFHSGKFMKKKIKKVREFNFFQKRLLKINFLYMARNIPFLILLA